MSGQHQALAALPQKKPVPIEQEAEYIPELVWTFRRKEKFLASICALLIQKLRKIAAICYGYSQVIQKSLTERFGLIEIIDL